MLNNNISKIIVTFAFFYSSLICHFKAIELYDSGRIMFALFLWFCALCSFCGALRFQIAKLVDKLKFKEKKWIEFVIIVKVFISLIKKNFLMDVRHLVSYQKTPLTCK